MSILKVRFPKIVFLNSEAKKAYLEGYETAEERRRRAQEDLEEKRRERRQEKRDKNERE